MNPIYLNTRTISIAGFIAISCLAIAACTPTVKVQAPQEPITINLNIKLDADVRVKLEDQARQDIASNPELF